MKNNSFVKLNFFKGDLKSIESALCDLQWEEMLRGLSLGDSWDCFAEIIVQLVEKIVPVSRANSESRKNNPPVSPECIAAIRIKRRK